MQTLSYQQWITKPKLNQLLATITASGNYDETAYITPRSVEHIKNNKHIPIFRNQVSDKFNNHLVTIVDQSSQIATGMVVFWNQERSLVLMPPFPISDDLWVNDVEPSDLINLLNKPRTIGVVLLRLGRYAIGVTGGDKIIASKTGTRYVKHRHRAGGSSQRRFERSRERLIREFFDEACAAIKKLFLPFPKMDHVILGGEKQTLMKFEKRCSVVQQLKPITLSRILNIDNPGQVALGETSREIWKSRIFGFSEKAHQREWDEQIPIH